MTLIDYPNRLDELVAKVIPFPVPVLESKGGERANAVVLTLEPAEVALYAPYGHQYLRRHPVLPFYLVEEFGVFNHERGALSHPVLGHHPPQVRLHAEVLFRVQHVRGCRFLHHGLR